MQVEAVLFDLFNTLVLIEKDEVFYPPSLQKLYEALVKHGVTAAFKDFSRVYFDVRDRLYAESKATLEEPHFNVRVSRTLQELGYHVSDQIVKEATAAFSSELIRYICLDEDANQVLEKLSGKCKLGLVSNFGIPELVWDLLDKFDLKKYFDAALVSAEVNRRKPSPEIFEMALTKLNVDASKTLFVGDTPRLDIEGPKSSGIKTVLITREADTAGDSRMVAYQVSDKETDIKPDYTIRRLEELLAILGLS